MDLKKLHNHAPLNTTWPEAHEKDEEGLAGMLRLGTDEPKTREMDLDDIFLSRLKLLIIMGKSYLDGLPLGEQRRQAMLSNADHIELESVDLGCLVTKAPFEPSSVGTMDFDHLFYQRVKLLSVMIKTIAKGFPMGEHRKIALQENLDVICQALTFNSKTDMDFLKVA